MCEVDRSAHTHSLTRSLAVADPKKHAVRNCDRNNICRETDRKQDEVRRKARAALREELDTVMKLQDMAAARRSNEGRLGQKD